MKLLTSIVVSERATDDIKNEAHQRLSKLYSLLDNEIEFTTESVKKHKENELKSKFQA